MTLNRPPCYLALELSRPRIDNRSIEKDVVYRPLTKTPLIALTTFLALIVAPFHLTASPDQTQDEPQKPPTTFRSSLDLIAVDVQVIDREGTPVAGLGPDKFEVTINGRRRRVVSANLIESRSATTLTPEERATAASGSPVIPNLARVVFLAIDCLSFDASASRHVIATARDFIDKLPVTDEVGLFAYPYGPKMMPTTDHAAVSRALATVMGQRDVPSNQFHLRPSEVVDLSAAASSAAPREASLLEAVVRRECGNPPEDVCRQRLMLEITGAVLYYEGQGNAGLGMLRSLLQQINAIAGRKTLVLISAGMMASDVPGGRPDISELGMQVGKEAARSNTSVYTLYLDTAAVDRFNSEVRSGDKNLQSVARDSEVLGRWLDQFSGAAGGAMFKVQVGTGEYAFDRIFKEISAYYLLGVEPAEADRDGRTHEIKVKTTERNALVRGRRWVAVPKRDRPASEGIAEPSSSPPAPAPMKSTPPPPRVAVNVQALADLYGQGDTALQKGLAQTQDLAGVIRDFRASDSPWPDAPRRTAVFALQLGIAGLRSDNRYARDEGGRLLAEYNARVRVPSGADAFECSWLWTEVAALEGLFMADSAMLFVPRAVERCPAEARLHLAHAIVSEQQWLRGTTGSDEEAKILARYEQAITFQETGAEARMRAAWFLCRTGKLDQALALIDKPLPPNSDRYIQYLTELVRGQILRAQNRPDEAARAFRAALTTWPGAQSARVALMTLLLSRGERQEAATLADAAETAPPDQFDPWWTYWLGDYRAYPAIVAKLRELAQ